MVVFQVKGIRFACRADALFPPRDITVESISAGAPDKRSR